MSLYDDNWLLERSLDRDEHREPRHPHRLRQRIPLVLPRSERPTTPLPYYETNLDVVHGVDADYGEERKAEEWFDKGGES